MTKETLERAKAIEQEIKKYEDLIYLLQTKTARLYKKKKDIYVLAVHRSFNSFYELPLECKSYVARFYQEKIKKLEEELKNL